MPESPEKYRNVVGASIECGQVTRDLSIPAVFATLITACTRDDRLIFIIKAAIQAESKRRLTFLAEAALSPRACLPARQAQRSEVEGSRLK